MWRRRRSVTDKQFSLPKVWQLSHFFGILYSELEAKELCNKMSFADLLAIIGGMTVAFYLLKLTWRCWCGFREFVLSSKWQVDLRTYGRWAGKVKEEELQCNLQM